MAFHHRQQQHRRLISSLLLVAFISSSTITTHGQQQPQQQQQQKPPPQDSNRMCPLDEHVICNEGLKEFRCVCTMFGSNEPPPEQSCSNLLNFTGYRGDTLEAVSAKLRLKPSFFPEPKLAPNTTATSNWADNYLEEKFKAQLAWNFKIHQDKIVFLRLRCQEDGTSDVIVQFVVLRKSRKSISPPLSRHNLVSANTVVNRMKAMRDRISGLEIAYVEKVHELLPVEVNIDNTRLIIQAIVVFMFMFITCLCGCWVSCRRRNPEDDGYQDVMVQQQQQDKV